MSESLYGAACDWRPRLQVKLGPVQVSAAAVPEALLGPFADTAPRWFAHPDRPHGVPVQCCTACRSAFRRCSHPALYPLHNPRVLVFATLNEHPSSCMCGASSGPLTTTFSSIHTKPSLTPDPDPDLDPNPRLTFGAARSFPRPDGVDRLERSQWLSVARGGSVPGESRQRLETARAAAAARAHGAAAAAYCDLCRSTGTQAFSHLSQLRSLTVQVAVPDFPTSLPSPSSLSSPGPVSSPNTSPSTELLEFNLSCDSGGRRCKQWRERSAVLYPGR